MYNKIGGGILALVGIYFVIGMIYSTFNMGVDWFLRTGWVGLTVGTTMFLSGIWSWQNREYNLIVRSIWSVLWLVGSILALWTIIGFSQSGNAVLFIGGTIVILSIYIGLIGTTILDIYSRV